MRLLPLIFIFYANFLPSGLYIYYITSTVISIIQQYLIVGWGSHLPALRLESGLRPQPHSALPGRHLGAEPIHARGGSARAIHHRARTGPPPASASDRPAKRTRPPGPTRETSLT